MPSIIKNEAQIQALADIEKGLESVDLLNKIILSDGSGVSLTVSTDTAKGRGATRTVEVDQKEEKALKALCSKMRDRLVKDITQKAGKFQISLDDDDKKKLAPVNA